jgi:hypothetical protein
MSEEKRVTLPIPTGESVHASANLPEGHTPVIDTKFMAIQFVTLPDGTMIRQELPQPPDTLNTESE